MGQYVKAPATLVLRSKTFEKQLSRIPNFMREKVNYWIFSVEIYGLAEVMKSPGFHDEPLQGDRKGQRSVRMNRSYRLIYRVIHDRVLIELLEVHKHGY